MIVTTLICNTMRQQMWKTSFPKECSSIMYVVVLGIDEGEKFRAT